MSLGRTSPTDKTEISDKYIDESFQEMLRIIREIAPYITTHAGVAKEIVFKDDQSPVTPHDIEVEKIISARMSETFPLIPVLGEEMGYDEYDLPEICWLVDPIDGTKYYISGDAKFTTMASLVRQGQVIAAIIYDPTKDDAYTAQVGRGAYKNGERIYLNTVPLPTTLYCKRAFVDRINTGLKEANIVVTAKNAEGGGGHGFIKVLDGTIAARVNMLGAGYLHDYAPGGFLVREAGGALIPIAGDTYTMHTRSFIACHPALESFFIAMRQQLRAAEQEEMQKKL